MILFRDVRAVVRLGRDRREVFRCLSMQLPTDHKMAILSKSAQARQELVQLICGTKEPDAGMIERHANVSHPIGFSSGLYSKLTIRDNILFVAKLFGLDWSSMLRLVASLLGPDAQLDTYLGDLPPSYRINLAFCLSYTIPCTVYVANSVLMPSDEDLRRRLTPLVQSRLVDAGLIFVTGAPQAALATCEEAAVLHGDRLLHFDSVKAAVAFFRGL